MLYESWRQVKQKSCTVHKDLEDSSIQIIENYKTKPFLVSELDWIVMRVWGGGGKKKNKEKKKILIEFYQYQTTRRWRPLHFQRGLSPSTHSNSFLVSLTLTSSQNKYSHKTITWQRNINNHNSVRLRQMMIETYALWCSKSIT